MVEAQKVISIPIGPQHPITHEPISIRIAVEGEYVTDVWIDPGYNHRGIMWLCERRNFIQIVHLCSRVCGICTGVHSVTVTQAIEDLAGIEPPPRAKWLRVLLLELERIHSHMLILAIMAEAIGFDTLFMLMMRDRERVLYLRELLTGNRVMTEYLTPGGVRRDVNSFIIDEIRKHINFIEERMKYYKKVWEEDPIINKRLRDVGYSSATQAVAHGLVGPVLRGSGVPSDVRKDYPYAAYDEVPFNVITYKEGDSWARMMVRVDETLESINMVKYVIEHLPQGPIQTRFPIYVAPGEGFSISEAPRGELLYHIIHRGGMIPYRVHIRTPSLTNIHNGAYMLLGSHIADVPVIFVSYDPCIACTERVMIYDLREKKVKITTLKQLAMLKNKR